MGGAQSSTGRVTAERPEERSGAASDGVVTWHEAPELGPGHLPTTLASGARICWHRQDGLGRTSRACRSPGARRTAASAQRSAVKGSPRRRSTCDSIAQASASRGFVTGAPPGFHGRAPGRRFRPAARRATRPPLHLRGEALELGQGPSCPQVVDGRDHGRLLPDVLDGHHAGVVHALHQIGDQREQLVLLLHQPLDLEHLQPLVGRPGLCLLRGAGALAVDPVEDFVVVALVVLGLVVVVLEARALPRLSPTLSAAGARAGKPTAVASAASRGPPRDSSAFPRSFSSPRGPCRRCPPPGRWLRGCSRRSPRSPAVWSRCRPRRTSPCSRSSSRSARRRASSAPRS